MGDIDSLEYAVGDDLRVKCAGRTFTLPGPRAMNFQVVLQHLHLEHAPNTPAMPEWKRALVFERWRLAHDLPPFEQARRLTYLVDHYRDALTADLTPIGVDLIEMWRSRRWRTLLAIIDRLPAHSHYASAVGDDEEHMEMLAQAMANRKAGDEPKKPLSMIGWTREASLLEDVYEAVRHVAHTVAAVQLGQKAGQPPKPRERPMSPLQTAMEKATLERKEKSHKRLVARVLPHKSTPAEPVE